MLSDLLNNCSIEEIIKGLQEANDFIGRDIKLTFTKEKGKCKMILEHNIDKSDIGTVLGLLVKELIRKKLITKDEAIHAISAALAIFDEDK